MPNYIFLDSIQSNQGGSTNEIRGNIEILQNAMVRLFNMEGSGVARGAMGARAPPPKIPNFSDSDFP